MEKGDRKGEKRQAEAMAGERAAKASRFPVPGFKNFLDLRLFPVPGFKNFYTNAIFPCFTRLYVLFFPFLRSVNEQTVAEVKKRWVELDRPRHPDWTQLLNGLNLPPAERQKNPNTL